MKNFLRWWSHMILWLALSMAPVAWGEIGLPAGVQKMTFEVDGVQREALVYIPASAKTADTPVVFAFHGHGGSARNALRSFAMNEHWPEAISVYMQGLPTRGELTDHAGRRDGWQAKAGDEQDRDLKFFDAVLARLKKGYRVDARRIYATGHSNGGGFTYLLWLTRGEVFAAVAPSAAVATYAQQLTPKSVMHIAGERDPLVKFAWQTKMMETLRHLNVCQAEGQPWGEHGIKYDSASGTPVVTWIFSGGHELDRSALPWMVKFFKEHPAH